MSTKIDNAPLPNVNIFSEIGISESEQKTLSALFSFPKGATVLQLKEKRNIPRPTLYTHLETLENIGVVIRTKREHGTLFFVAQKETVMHIFEERAKRISTACMYIGKLFEQAGLDTPYTARFSVLDKGNVAEKFFWDILHNRPKRVDFFWPAHSMFHTVPDTTFSEWYQERIARGIHARILWPHAQKVSFSPHSIIGKHDSNESLREVRVLPKAIDAHMAYAIYDNKVAYLSSKQEHYGIIIDSRDLSNLARSIFNFLWQTAKAVKK